jgi:hypothetical protein
MRPVSGGYVRELRIKRRMFFGLVPYYIRLPKPNLVQHGECWICMTDRDAPWLGAWAGYTKESAWHGWARWIMNVR